MNTDDCDLQWQIRRTLQCMRPYDALGMTKVRVGSMNDGGYIMLADFETARVAYSLGIGGDVTWDLAMASRGMIIHQYDHTVPQPPVSHPNFRFNMRGIAASNEGEFISIPSAIEANGDTGRRDLILKIDIECAEWAALDPISSETLGQFQQIVAELHGFLRIREPDWRANAQRVLGHLHRTHAPYHVHANNWGDFQVIANVPVPDVVEVSYVRRDRAIVAPSGTLFPTPLDAPCHPDRPDIILGNFSFM